MKESKQSIPDLQSHHLNPPPAAPCALASVGPAAPYTSTANTDVPNVFPFQYEIITLPWTVFKDFFFLPLNNSPTHPYKRRC